MPAWPCLARPCECAPRGGGPRAVGRAGGGRAGRHTARRFSSSRMPRGRRSTDRRPSLHKMMRERIKTTHATPHTRTHTRIHTHILGALRDSLGYRGEVLGGPRSFGSRRCGFLRRSVGSLGLVWGVLQFPFEMFLRVLEGPWTVLGVAGGPWGSIRFVLCFIVMLHFFSLINYRIN